MPEENHPEQSAANPAAPLSEILAQAQTDIENHPNQEVHLVMRLPEGLALIGLLQLVCRHPELPERQVQVAQEVVKSLEKQIAITPALKQLIAMGWQPKYDYKLTGQEGEKIKETSRGAILVAFSVIRLSRAAWLTG